MFETLQSSGSMKLGRILSLLFVFLMIGGCGRTTPGIPAEVVVARFGSTTGHATSGGIKYDYTVSWGFDPNGSVHPFGMLLVPKEQVERLNAVYGTDGDRLEVNVKSRPAITHSLGSGEMAVVDIDKNSVTILPGKWPVSILKKADGKDGLNNAFTAYVESLKIGEK